MRACLLAAGIFSLLEQRGDLKAICLTGSDDDIRLALGRLRPTVLVIDAQTPASRLSDWLAEMDQASALRILRVHPDTNQVDIFDQQQIILERAADFMGAVNPHPAEPALGVMGSRC
jgi:hypothetical protein